MRFVTARELRNRASDLWDELSRERELVVTVNGRPVAVITGLLDHDLEQTLRALRRARAQAGLSGAQRKSMETGLDRLTSEDIEAEISAVRKTRRK